jgi:hypothetical protein
VVLKSQMCCVGGKQTKGISDAAHSHLAAFTRRMELYGEYVVTHASVIKKGSHSKAGTMKGAQLDMLWLKPQPFI